MKKILILFLGAALIAPQFACKKGENDPFISFRSRKARLEGNWKIKKHTEAGQSQLDPDQTTIAEFKKDGTFTTTVKENGQPDNMQKMKWAFLSGVGDAKNKERILITWENSLDGEIYFIDELKNKSMKWTYEYDDNGKTVKGEMEFEQD